MTGEDVRAARSATRATGIWAMEDLLVFGDGRELHGAGHHHETYEILKVSGGS